MPENPVEPIHGTISTGFHMKVRPSGGVESSGLEATVLCVDFRSSSNFHGHNSSILLLSIFEAMDVSVKQSREYCNFTKQGIDSQEKQRLPLLISLEAITSEPRRPPSFPPYHQNHRVASRG